ncbi:hypothetical protein Dehly_1465 [Dehalogenimonas lykanthroporepellens BL-DC-9]|jgi:predicted unusual protein kinase regulating ubiquinone biosynthesis (AarF/ABC1/UbiB family)|nr:hypothetical protein Dehly_1465 [Dehalogenimonas lykanthroporepellens BL-DC-9]
MSNSMFEFSFAPGEEVVIKIKAPDLKRKMDSDTLQHLMGAKKEMLMALRGLLDEAIVKTEESASPAPEKTHIDVE